MAVLVDKKSVVRTLFSMAAPMLAGTVAINAYNLTDTYFVSRLGTLPLAAMGFTFPVVMLLRCIAQGLGVGITTLTSHALGRHDREDAARLVTHGILTTLGATAVVSLAGYLSIEPIFKALGADTETLPLIAQYMRVWFAGALFTTLPMIGNGVLISTGDSKAAGTVLVVGMLLNVILDPIMIFGYLGCPAMGMRGAALATVISQGVATVWLLRLLCVKHNLVASRRRDFNRYFVSLRRISAFAFPSICSMILMPLSATVITRILSGFGNEAVAAAGAAARIEMFAFVVPMALGISLTPFISQNFGAARLDRVREAQGFAIRFALVYGGFVAIAFFATAPWIASVFTEDPRVGQVLINYIRIISFGYGMMEVHRYCGFVFTGLHRPASAMALNAVRVLVLLVPLSYLGGHFGGVEGVFWGRLATDLAAGSIGIIWLSRRYRSVISTVSIR